MAIIATPYVLNLAAAAAVVAAVAPTVVAATVVVVVAAAAAAATVTVIALVAAADPDEDYHDNDPPPIAFAHNRIGITHKSFPPIKDYTSYYGGGTDLVTLPLKFLPALHL